MVALEPQGSTATAPRRAQSVKDPVDDGAGSWFRVVTLLVVVWLFALGQLSVLVGWRLVGELATSVFLQAGPGVVLCAFLPVLPRHVHVLLSVVSGAAITTVLASISALTGAFSLDLLWWVLAAAVLVGAVVGVLVHVRALIRSAVTPAGPIRPGWITRAYPVVLTVVGFAVALVSAAARAGDPQRQGAALTAGPPWFAGVLLVLLGLGLAWAQRGSIAVPVLGLTSVVVASQGLMYREPTAVVAARHIGLVEYILSRGVLDRSTDIYQAWAGLFASAALNARAAGIDDLFRYATWWGVLAAPLMVLAVRSLAGRLVDARRAWLAGLLFGLGSSLNTSFFAPQVYGFVLAITVLALLVVVPGERPLLPLPAAVPLVLVMNVANALSHQISPYMLALALLALAVFRLVRPRWAFLLALVPAVAWALVNQHLLNNYVSVSAVGRLFQNLAPPEHSVGTFPLPLANRLAFNLPAAALVVIGLVALASLWRRRDRVAWGLAFAAGSPVVLMLGTDYGNEGIFRVVLFALPWLALLACLPATRPARFRVPAPGVVGAVAITLLLVVNVIGLTAMDWARVVRSGDVAAARWIEQRAIPGTVVLTLGSDLTIPERSLANYANTGWVARQGLVTPPEPAYPRTTGAAYDAAADLRQLTADFVDVPGRAHFAVVANSSGAYDERYGNQRYADHQKLGAAIKRSKEWVLVHSTPGVSVYRLRSEVS